MIAANFYAYWYIHSPAMPAEQLTNLILYPANLLNGNLYCVFTSGFIHLDLSHLLVNMLGVFVFARVVENHLGVVKTLYIYFGALFISLLFAMIVNMYVLEKNIAIIGASGALMGLIAAAMLLDPFKITYEMIFPVPVMMKGWLFIYLDLRGIMSGQNDGVSHFAHLFGYLSIALLVYFMSNEDKKKMQIGLIINIISFIIFILARSWFLLKMASGV